MSEPIYALATPVGRSAIAVVRVSGEGLPKDLFQKLSLNPEERGVFVRRVQMGSFSDSCLIINFPSPASYTGEHLVEIHTHGSPAIIAELFSLLESLGLREAEGGEFSKRSFLNNKMDLSSAESVMSGIFAESAQELAALEEFRSGSLGDKVKDISKKIEGVLVEVESQLDFSDEEDVAGVDKDQISGEVGLLRNKMDFLIKNFSPLTKDSEKKKVVLTGRPNVGKSSLFNALLGEKTAIVSEHPGTTRDIVRRSLFLSGTEVHFLDTAGIRDVEGSEIEAEGIEMAKAAVSESDLCVEVFDDPKDVVGGDTSSLVVLNKSDLFDKIDDVSGCFVVSAKTGTGLKDLQEEILKRVNTPIKENLVSERVYLSLESACRLLDTEIAGDDFYERTAQNLRDCLKELESIYGVFDNDVVLDQIFSNFCIGK